MVCELISRLGYQSDFPFMDSFVLICVSEADISGDRKLFVKMSDGNRVLILLLTLVFEIEKALMKSLIVL